MKPKMQSTAQTSGGQARLTLCGTDRGGYHGIGMGPRRAVRIWARTEKSVQQGRL